MLCYSQDGWELFLLRITQKMIVYAPIFFVAVKTRESPIFEIVVPSPHLTTLYTAVVFHATDFKCFVEQHVACGARDKILF